MGGKYRRKLWQGQKHYLVLSDGSQITSISSGILSYSKVKPDGVNSP